MILYDTFTVDSVRRTEDGYLAAFARVARTGIQEYKGSELGRPDLDVVRVYRSPEEVFAPDALRSFAHRPVTLKHPPVPVTAKNWKKYGGGQTGDEVVRDGEYVRVPMVMMDQALISAYERGTKQLSMGYSTDLKWRTGVVDSGPDAGQSYDAVQTAIRGNHLAVVPLARGGDQLRIGDFRDLVEQINDDYIGDSDEMYDRDFSTEQREKLAASGAAMPGGGFPIKSLGDLKNAIRAIGRAHDPSAAKAHIIKRAKALGAEKELPETWAKDSSPHDDDYDDCPNCGADMPLDATDCSSCGYHVTKSTKDGATTMKRIMIDSVPVDVSDDQGAAIIERHVLQLTTQVKDATTKLTDQQAATAKVQTALDAANVTVSAKDGEIAVLKKQVADAAVTPALLDQMVKERSAVIDAASSLLDKTFAFDGKTVGDIKRAAVEAYLGDAAKGMDDGAVSGAFIAATKDAKTQGGGSQPIRRAMFANGGRMPVGDAREVAYDARVKAESEAWRTAGRAKA